MNKHICKAKRVDNGEWVEGYVIECKKSVSYTKYKDSCVMINDLTQLENGRLNGMLMVEVDPKTVCRYTEIKDKDGKPVFEGDKVFFEGLILGEDDFTGIVKMIEGCWMIDNGTDAILLWQECSPIKIIDSEAPNE